MPNCHKALITHTYNCRY